MPVKNNKAFSLSENTEGSPDPIRNTIQSFWIYDGSELTYDTRNSYNSTTKEAKTSLLLFDFQDNLNTEDNSIKLDSDTTLTLKTYKERIDITPVYLSEGSVIGALSGRSSSGRIEADPENNFDSYIEDQIIPSLGVSRIEYKLDLGSPVEYASAVDNNSVIAGTVNFVYNYGLELYEDIIQEGSISESSLVNFYTFSPVIPSLTSFSTSLAGLPAVTEKVPLTKRLVSEDLISNPKGSSDIQDFFMNSEGFLEALELQQKRDTFPFYNEVYFTNPADTLENDKFRESLRESGLIISFCDLMNREDFRLSQDQEVPVVDGLSFANSYLSSSYEDATQTSFKEQSALKTETVRLYDIPEMLKIMHAAIPKLPIEGVGVDRQPANQVDATTLRSKGFLTDGEQADYRLDTISKIKPISNISIDYENALDGLVSTINELTSNLDNFKNYKEILEGKDKTYQSDVLFYRIKKYEEGSGTPIQNFWIPAEKGYRGIRYIDTQVKYGKMYRYEICAFKFVIGSEYEFLEKDSGVINFGEDLAEFIKGSEKNLEDLIGISLIRPAIQQTADDNSAALPPELGFGTINVDELTAVSIADFIEERNIISSNLVEVNNYSRIALFANSIDLLGVGTYRGVKISQDNLTEKELQKLETIRQSWACLTNTNKSDPNKLAEIEILLNKVVALGNIREKIIERYEVITDRKDKWKKFWEGFAIALGSILLTIATGGLATAAIFAALGPTLALAGLSAAGVAAGVSTILGATLGGSSKRVNSTGLTPADLKSKDLKNLYADIAALTSVSRAPLSIGADDRYWIDLNSPVTFNGADPDLPEEFTKIGRRETLPISKYDFVSELGTNASVIERSKEIEAYNETKRYHIELVESIFELRANQLGALIEEYLGCYQDFIEAASDFNVVLDYKRINKYSLIIRTKPTMKLAELPYYRSEGMILDNPPIYPNVNVVTYRGIADKLSFFMNSGQGEIEVSPITFSDEEEIFLSNYRKSRKLNDFQPILYKSDETENLGTVF
ncbi:MAG: hypothetical protein ACR2M6_02990, partial [Vampirovibrionia bacterium]